MTITWTEEAIDSFDEICEAMAARSPEVAQRFANAVTDALDQLARFPESGRMVPEHQNPRLREVLVQRHRVIYRLSPDGIVIEVLVHASFSLAD